MKNGSVIVKSSRDLAKTTEKMYEYHIYIANIHYNGCGTYITEFGSTLGETGETLKSAVRSFITTLNSDAILMKNCTFDAAKKCNETIRVGKILSISDIEEAIHDSMIVELKMKEHRMDLVKKRDILLQLPEILSRMTDEAWFSIFTFIDSPKELFRCSQVCKNWQCAIQKYRNLLGTSSNEFIKICTGMEFDGKDQPLWVRSTSNSPTIFMHLLGLCPQYAIKLLPRILQSQQATITFKGHVTGKYEYHDDLLNIKLQIVLNDNIPYPYESMSFSPKILLKWLNLIESIDVYANGKGRKIIFQRK